MTPTWLLPAALAAGVVALALTQRRTGPQGAAGETHVPGRGRAVTFTGAGVTGLAPAPAPARDELVATHRLLMSRVQQDPRSVDPAALEHLARLLADARLHDEASEASAWARHARHVAVRAPVT